MKYKVIKPFIYAGESALTDSTVEIDNSYEIDNFTKRGLIVEFVEAKPVETKKVKPKK